MLQTSSSQVQLSLLVQNVQLDNQLLETRHPVVLSSGASNQSSYTDLRLNLTDTDKLLEDLMLRGQLAGRGAAGRVGGITSSSAAADLVGIGVVGKGEVIGSRLKVTGGGSGAGVLQQPQARPVIWLSLCQLLTGATAGPSPQRMAMAAAATSSALAANTVPQSSEQAEAEAQLASAAAAAAAGAAVSKAAIVSFRKIELQLGALDFETEQVGAVGGEVLMLWPGVCCGLRLCYDAYVIRYAGYPSKQSCVLTAVMHLCNCTHQQLWM